MKKLVAIAVAVVLLLTMAVTVPVAAQTEIHVYPGDSIQAAVDSASPGDTIIVHAGEYHQSVKISTNDITLKGEAGTILDGDGPADTGTNFWFLEDSEQPPNIWKIGIWLSEGVRGVTITGFEIRDYGEPGMAIWLERFSHDNRVIKNEFTGYTMVGIMVSTSNDNLIMKNKVSNSGVAGIVLEQQSRHNKVIENKITNSAVAGIILDEDSTYNIIEKNKVSNSFVGIMLGDSHYNEVIENKITNSAMAGIILNEGSTGNLIEKNNVSNSGMAGIMLGDSHNNEVIENKVTDSALWGIVLAGSSSDNLVKGNKVSGSGDYDLCEVNLTDTSNVWEDNKYETFGIVVLPEL